MIDWLLEAFGPIVVVAFAGLGGALALLVLYAVPVGWRAGRRAALLDAERARLASATPEGCPCRACARTAVHEGGGGVA